MTIQFAQLPPVVPHPLDFSSGWIRIAVPSTKENLITNPSFEDGIGDWATQYLNAPVVGTVETEQTSGVRALSVTAPGNGNETGVSLSIPVLAGVKYTISFDFKSRAPTARFVAWLSEGFSDYADGRPHVFLEQNEDWRRYSVSFAFPVIGVGTDIFFTISRLSGQGDDVFFFDSVLLETGDLTTYFDGDTKPLVISRPEGELDQPQFYWTGEPHKSTSIRTEWTRAGGAMVNLRELGWITTGVVGLGMPDFDVIGAPYAIREGAEFRRSLAKEREFSIVGRVQGRNYEEYMRNRRAIELALSPLGIHRSQPMILEFTPVDSCGKPMANPMWIEAAYTGGFSGSITNWVAEDTTINFRSLNPYARQGHHQRGAYLEKQTALTGKINRRAATGQWSSISYGAFSNNLGLVKYGPDGAVYVAYYDSNLLTTIRRLAPGATSWTTIVSIAVINGGIADMVFTPDWKLWFSVASAAIATQRVGVYDMRLGTTSYNTPSALNAQEYVHALAVEPRGGVYAVSDYYTGSAFEGHVWRYDTYQSPSGWKLYGEAEGRLLDVAVNRAGRVFITGEFDLITNYDGTPVPVRSVATMIPIGIEYYWTPMNVGIYINPTSHGIGQAIVVAPDNSVYVGGEFDYAGGTLAPVGDANNVARWNQTGWEALRTGVGGGEIDNLYVADNGDVYAFGDFTSVDGFPINKSARWRKGYWLPFYIRGDLLPGTWAPTSMDFGNGGEIALVTNTTVTSKVAGYTLVTNTGTAPSNVTIRVTGEGTLYYIVNHSTQNDIYFNGGLFVYVGEVITMDFHRLRPAIRSSIRGDLMPFVTPNSRIGNFRVLPGKNHFEVMMDFAATSAGIQSRVFVYWDLNHLGIEGGAIE